MYNYPIHNLVFGKGKSFVLFLHGWGGSTNSFLSVAKRVALQHKVMLIDFYGFGKSKYPNAVLDSYEYALQLYLFLKRKKINELSIVAHSFGGRIATILTSVFDIKIKQIILIDSAGITPRRNIKYKYKVLKYKLYKRLAKLNLISNNKLLHFGSDEYKLLNSLQKKSYTKIVNQGLEYLMPLIKSRTLIVWGKEDKTTPLYMARKIKSLIKDSCLIVYDKSGHFPFLENYMVFCNLLITYLKE